MLKAKEIARKLANRYFLDQYVKEYMAYNKRRWISNNSGGQDSVVLLDRFDLNPVIHCFSYVANYMARRTNSRIVTFHFTRSLLTSIGIPERRLEKIYNSFGAELGLSLNWEHTKRFQADADRFLDQVYSKIKTKQELVDLTIEDLHVGDFIYDSYLRKGKFTANLKDPELIGHVRDAYLIYRICKDYLACNNVKAILTSHTVYNSHGILSRLAIRKGIPVYYIINLDNLTIREVRDEVCYLREYQHYRRDFSALPESEKPAFKKEAATILSGRIEGKIDWGIADAALGDKPPESLGYGQYARHKVLEDTGRPRMLVLMHCFFDSPHIYKQMLFPDFWEWLCFLLEKASATEFDWYLKPHPAGRPGNEEVIDLLKKKFPKARFLNRKISNRQIVEEGIRAMFTVHGTAAHEFAYMGVPVVTAGDNPQINYDFNIHAKSISEYERYIKTADQLKVNLNKEDIEEFFYMHNIYLYKNNPFGARIVEEDLSYHKLCNQVNKTSIFKRYIEAYNPSNDKNLETYFEYFFSPRLGPGKETKPSSYNSPVSSEFK